MNRLLFSLAFFSPVCMAGFAADLTNPDYQELAGMYPAYEFITVMSFEDTQKNYAIVAFKDDKDDEDHRVGYTAEINSSKAGKQKLYIFFTGKCTISEAVDDPIILKTNEQNVKYSTFCDGQRSYLTPTSSDGAKFLVDEFRTKDYVRIEFPGINVGFDAAGFIEAWDSYGGDAL